MSLSPVLPARSPGGFCWRWSDSGPSMIWRRVRDTVTVCVLNKNIVCVRLSLLCVRGRVKVPLLEVVPSSSWTCRDGVGGIPNTESEPRKPEWTRFFTPVRSNSAAAFLESRIWFPSIHSELCSREGGGKCCGCTGSLGSDGGPGPCVC